MKIRDGFVSNSSSSSFVVAFPKKPESVEELRDVMFPRAMKEVEMYGESLTVEVICREVFSDIKKQGRSASRKAVKEALRGHYSNWWGRSFIKGAPIPEEYTTEEDWRDAYSKYWKDYNEEARKFETEAAREFLEKHKGSFILCISYADDTSFEAVLEHGDIFRNLGHIRASQH